MPHKNDIGPHLLNKKLITQEQLDKALQEQTKTSKSLDEVLLGLKFIEQDSLLTELSELLNIQTVNLISMSQQINIDFAKFLPESYARNYNTILFKEEKGIMFVAMADPWDITSTDIIESVLKKPIRPLLALESDILKTLDLVYRNTDKITNYAKELRQEVGEGFRFAQQFTAAPLTDTRVDAPVIQLLNSLFEDAVQLNASDIHIEPDENVLRFRLRIDGLLYEQIMKETTIASAIALRLKLMSGLNISEKRIPQDGRFQINVRNHVVDVRLSTMPTQYGESLVMRLLDQASGILNLKQTGLPDSFLENFRRLLRKPFGILLVTGPTGSGKSTTLYGALNEINESTKNIVTVEDPVEYRLPRLNQVQVNYKIGLDFATVLKATLRQDPDIVMVGEMRDEETVTIALRAALTGHLVLSTLHTNDSISSPVRLLDMGAQGFLVAATIQGILAQRLLRRICPNCKETYTLTDPEKFWLEAASKIIDVPEELMKKDRIFERGTGCSYCNNSGYKGRIGIFELLELDSEMKMALQQNDPVAFTEYTTKKMRGRLLTDNAIAYIKEGITTVTESMRVLGSIG